MERFDSRVRETISKQFGCPPAAVEIRPLAAHASNRTYYRVMLRPQDTPRSVALMVLHGEDRGIKSDEIVEVEAALDELPFINVHRFIRSFSDAIPEVYHHDLKHGLLYLEDLGDVRFEHVVLPLEDPDRRLWYDRALDLLVLLQTEGTRRLTDACVASHSEFTETLFLWEFEHFVEYGYGTKLGRGDDAVELSVLRDAFAAVARQLARTPKVFTHRDFQSMNLMVQKNRLRLIDFQDALRGPRTYDLVALTRDSYVELSPKLLEQLLDDYTERLEAAGVKQERENFRTEFARMTLQRKLKDYGRFVYIDRVKGNPSYLRYNASNARYILDAASRIPELGKATAVLESVLMAEALK
jgi:aminoglycoside/choline kinase family phosphotransferase